MTCTDLPLISLLDILSYTIFFDVKPTIETAFKALKTGGVFYADLDPNFYFWDQIDQLQRDGSYHSIVKREIEMVTYKDEDILNKFGVPCETFNDAEYGKNRLGGFKEEGNN